MRADPLKLIAVILMLLSAIVSVAVLKAAMS